MFSRSRFLVMTLALFVAASPLPCEAYTQSLSFPLSGHRDYSTARGKVYFAETFGERNDGATLIIEVSNVPLPPGTELLVLVHEKEVGSLKLNSQRSGRLVLESGKKTSVPRLKTGSLVSVKIPGGATVVW